MAAITALPVRAQPALDQADPTRAERRVLENIKDDAPAPTALAVRPVERTDRSAEPGLTFGAVDLVDLEALPRAAFADIVEAYIGRTLGRDELAEMVDRLAARARITYPLASASIAPQAMRGGVLRVRIDEGRIDAVELTGAKNDAVLAALRPLASSEPVTTAELERRLLIAGDIDGITLGESRIVRDGERTVLRVTLSERPLQSAMTLDNDSTAALGPLELISVTRANGVLANDDSLQLYLLQVGPQFGELGFARLRYTKRVSAAGSELSLTGSYSRSAPGAELKPFRVRGESWLASVGVFQPLWRARASSLWLDGSLSHRSIDQDLGDVLARSDRLTVGKVGLSGFTKLAGGRLRTTASLSRGFDVLGASRSGDPLASRPDADGTFTALTLSADWSRSIAGNLGLDLGLRSQLASQPLLVSEEIGLGGAGFGRGYEYSERTGDQGAMAYGELHYSWAGLGPVARLQAYGFADGGVIRNLADGSGGGSLFSAGGGLRASVGANTSAGLELALPLSGARADSADKQPRIRFSFSRSL